MNRIIVNSLFIKICRKTKGLADFLFTKTSADDKNTTSYTTTGVWTLCHTFAKKEKMG